MKALRALGAVLVLSMSAMAQNYFLLSWAEGDLNSDGVPERVFLVSTQSADPSNARSEKLLLLMEYHQNGYRKAFSMPIRSGFFCKTPQLRLTSASADFWGLQYLAPAQGKPARFKVTFTPGSGEFFTIIHDGTTYRSESSGD